MSAAFASADWPTSSSTARVGVGPGAGRGSVGTDELRKRDAGARGGEDRSA